jgi:ParB family chromosome partitioning protein
METGFPQQKEIQMNAKNKLQSMTANLVVPDGKLESALPMAATNLMETRFPLAGAPAAPKTGPGQMLAFMGQKAEFDGELRSLKDRLSQFTDSMPTKKIDCADIEPSSWANRHPDAFRTAAFLRLKDDIESAGGNIQPILLTQSQDTGARYRIVFGHRRFNACKQLNLPVLAVVYDGVMNEKDLFTTMDRENRERADLTAYEQGRMYRMALDEGLYPSARKLAEELGVSHTWVNKSLAVADLPIPVIECFRSPLEIQARHAFLLAPVITKDIRSILKRAEKIRGQKLSAAQVVEELAGTQNQNKLGKRAPLHVQGKKVGTIEHGKTAIFISVDLTQLDEDKASGLQKLIEEYLNK